MATVDAAQARLDEAEAGQVLVIARRGKAVARMSPTAGPRKPMPLGDPAGFQASMPPLRRPAVDLPTEARD